jgi:hypothetical protein
VFLSAIYLVDIGTCRVRFTTPKQEHRHHAMTYLTATKLGIKEAELEALVEVQRGLASGELIEVAPDVARRASGNISDDGLYVLREIKEKTGKRSFCMLMTMNCGTVGCIGGWLGIQLGMDKDEASGFVMGTSRLSPFYELFYPHEIDQNTPQISRWKKITPKMAVMAIENFRILGKPCWVAVWNAHYPEDRIVGQ